MDLDVLSQDFEVKANPGLDTLDPRWAEISGLVQEGEFLKAGQQSAALLGDQVLDVRLLGYFAYGAFLEDGVGVFADLFGRLADLFAQRWEAMGPKTRRPETTASSLSWVVKQALRKLQREQGSQGAEWQRWTKLSGEEVEQAIAASAAFQEALREPLGAAAENVIRDMAKLDEWLRAFAQVVYVPPPPEPEPEPEPEEEAATEEAAPARAAPRSGGRGTDDDLQIQGSYPLRILIRKMEIFEQLIRREKFALARIVGDDVQQVISQFDPRVYFPHLFRGFFKQQALSVGDLMGVDELVDSPDWRALQALYQVDIEEFAAL